MNGFDIRAVGWVVTRDLCFEIVLVVFGAHRRIEPAASRSLLEAWRRLERAYANEQRPLVPYAAGAISSPLSSETAEALRTFARSIAALCPARYGVPVLERRCIAGLGQALGAGAAALLGAGAAEAWPPIGAGMGTLVLFAGWRLLTTLQLYRTLRIVALAVKP